MVIDKWTRTQDNRNLSLPLLGHKSKETFSELKKHYERLQNLNHKFKKHSPKNINDTKNSTNSIDGLEIKDYIDKINSIMLSINELITENDNFNPNDTNDPSSKDINSIIDKILSECKNSLDNIKGTEDDKIKDLDSESKLKEIKVVIDKISEKFKKEESEENTINVHEERRNTFNRFVDQGHLNIITHRREYNDATTVIGNNFQYTIENEPINCQMKFNIFFIVVLLLLFICYVFM